MKECPACGEPIDPDYEAIGVYCCLRREQRCESARRGRQTQIENGQVTHPVSARIGLGFYLMNWSENWERRGYQ